jgi:hypothetical protein
MLEHGLVAPTGHAKEKVVEDLFRLKVERLSVSDKVDELLQVAFSKKRRIFLVQFLQERILCLLYPRYWGAGRQIVLLTWSYVPYL